MAAGPAHAQVVLWLEPSAAAQPVPEPALEEREQDRTAKAKPKPTTRDPRLDRRVRAATAAGEEPLTVDPRSSSEFFSAMLDPSPILISSFSGGSGDGAVRASTTWVNQVTQNAGTISVGGTARDDNGWGGRLSVDASGMSYLNITAQRDAGNAAQTLFIQFEDLSLRTKVISVSTSQFALGASTLVQVPLTGWTIDFGPSQIVSWSIGGGSVGTTDFRMTFDQIAFSATAIPEPATSAAAGALAALAAGFWRRTVRRSRRS